MAGDTVIARFMSCFAYTGSIDQFPGTTKLNSIFFILPASRSAQTPNGRRSDSTFTAAQSLWLSRTQRIPDSPMLNTEHQRK